jgi:hypothetical protein
MVARSGARSRGATGVEVVFQPAQLREQVSSAFDAKPGGETLFIPLRSGSQPQPVQTVGGRPGAAPRRETVRGINHRRSSGQITDLRFLVRRDGPGPGTRPARRTVEKAERPGGARLAQYAGLQAQHGTPSWMIWAQAIGRSMRPSASKYSAIRRWRMPIPRSHTVISALRSLDAQSRR